MPDAIHSLSHAGFEAEISPAQGALIRRLRWRDRAGRHHDMLRLPFPDGDRPGSPRRFGLWPMVPFANRAFGAVMDDGQTRLVLPVNDPATGSCIHGFGWQAEWHVTTRSSAGISMEHRRESEADPYRYRAEMNVALMDDRVRIGLSVENLGTKPLPYGLGLHPWFPAEADTTLAMTAKNELVFGEGYRVAGIRALAAGGPYAQGPIIRSDREIAHSFIDWSGEAEIVKLSKGLAIHISASPSLRHPVVWAPAGADFLCIEPQSHSLGAPSEAVARAATPMARPATGETLWGWMELRPSSG